MEERPKIKVSLTSVDKAISLLAYTILAAVWAIALLSYSQLPDSIPIHFNSANQADWHGSKATLFLLPTIAIFIFGLLLFVSKKPEALNYPVTVTKENAAYQYRLATRILIILRLATMTTFMVIELQTISPAVHDYVGSLMLPFAVALSLAPVAYFIVKSMRNK